MIRHRLWITALACIVTGTATAQLVAPQTKGMLTLEYVYESSGQWADAQKNDRRDWRVNRTVSLSAQMVAEKPSPYAALLPGTGDEKRDLADRQQRIVSGNQKLAPMMGDIQKLMAKCGDDEACMERETKLLASLMDKSAVRSAGEDAAAAGRAMDNRYQLWRVSTYSGRYNADEVYNAALADPDCLSEPRVQCVSQQKRSGNGPVPTTQTPLAVMMEVDGPGKRLHIGLPVASGNMPVTRAVTGKLRDGKTGTFAEQLSFPWTRLKPLMVSIPNGLHEASGTQRLKIDGEFGEGGTLTVNWKFVVAR